MAPFTESLVDAAGVRVHLRRGGSGGPLLILHGDSASPAGSAPTRRSLEHYTVHVPSLPGFGQSSRPAFILGVRDSPPGSRGSCATSGWRARSR